jgi:hypothetical protein
LSRIGAFSLTHARTHTLAGVLADPLVTRAQFAKVEAEKDHLPLLKHVVIFNGDAVGTCACVRACVVSAPG